MGDNLIVLLRGMFNIKYIPKSIGLLVMRTPPILVAIEAHGVLLLDGTPFCHATNALTIVDDSWEAERIRAGGTRFRSIDCGGLRGERCRLQLLEFRLEY